MDNRIIFRKKSLDQIASPDRLNDYIRVANPGIWVVLISIVFVLIGVSIWLVFGSLDTIIKVPVVVNEGNTKLYVTQEYMREISPGIKVDIEGEEYDITSKNNYADLAEKIGDEFFLYAGDLSGDEWLCSCEISMGTEELADGVYSGFITLESVRPATFFVN